MARRCAQAGWSVRELERQVDARYGHAGVPLHARVADEQALLESLAERLTPLFGPSPVQIVPRPAADAMSCRWAFTTSAR